MPTVKASDEPTAVVMEYFARLNAGGNILELFSEDARCFFPKHSYARGIQEVTQLVMDVVPMYKSIEHDVSKFNFVVQDDIVVVEGASRGELSESAGGGTWTETEGGRFCNVFECSGGKITRLHYYLDPDYTGRDTARYPWLTGEAKSIG
jgi:ketosteroid isomerase-like protein